MSLTKWQEALSIIANIREFPKGRRAAAEFLIRYGIKELPSRHTRERPKKVSGFNSDDSGWIITEDLAIAVAKEALENP